MKAYIKAISYYLPTYNLSNEIIEKEFPEWSIEKISQKTGINNRFIASEIETSGDMAIKAAQKLFDENCIDKSMIDFIILCTQSPDYFLPTTACIVQNALGLKTSVGALDINLGCSGFVYGLGLAKGLIVSGQAKNILLLTSETYSKFIHPKDKSNKTIFGDAAAATLVASDVGKFELKEFVYGTDGSGAENLIVKNGAFRNFNSKSELKIDEYNNYQSDDHLLMNGGEIFVFTLKSVPLLLKYTQERNNLNENEIDLYIFHQANKFMLDSLRKKIRIPEEKFYTYIENCGNTVSSTIPIAIYNALKENRINLSDKILLAGFGVGYSWAGTIIESI
ncbi:MAG: ketoacyl-ACP synthase III [Chitinophagaceae bacterium]|nr:ketoacyl-ACP synthase III [Chitinophagaceae bacterium]